MDDQFYRRQREIEQRQGRDSSSRSRTTMEVHQIEQDKARSDPGTLRKQPGLDDPEVGKGRMMRWIVIGVVVVALAFLIVLFLVSGTTV